MGKIAFFRPHDERAAEATRIVRELGHEPVSDPMLEVDPTGESPREDAEFTVLTSRTGVELAAGDGWRPSGEIAAIGAPTAEALEAAGYGVDHVPGEYSSNGLVAHLRDVVDGATVEVARSDHGSPVLTDGLADAGAYVHETVLYRLVRPAAAGRSVELAVDGDLDAACFTSSLTVEHFLDVAEERGHRAAALTGLDRAVVGAIGDPTRATAEANGVDVDVVPEIAEFAELAAAVVDRL